MKATGIVRRIDELGRVVIPKEIRKTLRIKEGDPLEIYTDRDELLFKKYSPIASFENYSEGFTKSLNAVSEKAAVICDTDTVVSATGNGCKDLIGGYMLNVNQNGLNFKAFRQYRHYCCFSSLNF